MSGRNFDGAGGVLALLRLNLLPNHLLIFVGWRGGDALHTGTAVGHARTGFYANLGQVIHQRGHRVDSVVLAHNLIEVGDGLCGLQR